MSLERSRISGAPLRFAARCTACGTHAFPMTRLSLIFGRLFDALGAFNPRDVQQNIGSPNFGRFFNGVPRDFQTFVEFSRW